jgi:hypothetical protein
MSGLIRKVGTATFTGALMATVALAQGATIDGEVKKIDERERVRSRSSTVLPRASAWTSQ